MVNISLLLYSLATLLALARSADEYTAVAFKESFSHVNPMALDQQSYRELIQNSNIFIDKSLLLTKIITFEERTILITYPEKWGKSINLDMMKEFFGIEVDNNGEPLPRNDDMRQNYQLFQNGILSLKNDSEKLKTPLLISEKKSFINTFQGIYPVILIKMGDINGAGYDQIIDTISSRIKDAFQQHHYMRDIFDRAIANEDLSSEEKESMRCIKEKFEIFFNEKSDTNMLAEGLAFLSQVLHGYFNHRVLLLMDDYDGILDTLLNVRFPERHQQDIITFYSSLLTKTFVNNKYLEKGILTGKFQILSLFPSMNETKQYTVTDMPIYRYYGFTASEVDVLLKKLMIRYEQREKAFHWYNGYQCGRKLTMKLYNSRSISNFVCTRRINTYRVPSYANDPFLQSTINHIRFRAILVSLVNGKTYTTHFLRIDHSKLISFRQEFDDFTNNTIVVHRDIKLFLSYLNAVGYITVRRNKTYTDRSLEIPNNDIRTEISIKIMDYYKTKYAISSSTIDNVIHQLATFIDDDGNTTTSMTEALQSFFDNFPIYDDVSSNELMKFLLNFFAIQLGILRDRDTWVHNPPETINNELIVILYTLKRQVIIKAKLYASSEEENEQLERARTLDIVPPFEGIKITRIIMISIAKNKKVRVLGAKQKAAEESPEIIYIGNATTESTDFLEEAASDDDTYEYNA